MFRCQAALSANPNVSSRTRPVLRIHNEVARPNFTFVMDTGQWVDGANGGRARGEAGGNPAAAEVNYDWMAMCESEILAHLFLRRPAGSVHEKLSTTNEKIPPSGAPHASHIRAKFFSVDSGSEAWLDYPRIVNLLDKAGFNGTLGIVFEGGDVNSATDREVFGLCAAELRRLTRALPAKL